MARLTPEEQKNILTLHYEGKSIKDIMQATGRSREAIVRLFVACGIGEGSVQLNQIIWNKAERMYDEKCRRNPEYYKERSRFPSFYDLPGEIKRNWYLTAHKLYMEEAKTVIVTIMGEEVVESNKIEKVDSDEEKTCHDILKTLNRHQMNLMYKIKSRIADDQKIFDTFNDDQIDLLCAMIRASHA